MDEPIRLGIHRVFADMPDPRVERPKRHAWLDILTIAVCAVIAGADTFVDIEHDGHARCAGFATFLELPNGRLAHDTFGRVFARLDPIAVERGFLAWVQTLLPRPAGQVIAGDGKVARRSHDRGADCPPSDLLSAGASDHQLILGQLAVADHSNEIPAVPALLALVDVTGAVVTRDALHCQTETATAIRTGGGDYVLALKGNQPDAHAAVETFFAEASARTGAA